MTLPPLMLLPSCKSCTVMLHRSMLTKGLQACGLASRERHKSHQLI
jgi:hypothetical protein